MKRFLVLTVVLACNLGLVKAQDVVSAEFSLDFISKFTTYGVVDGKDPILMPCASVSFFNRGYLGIVSLYDVTKANGKRGAYGNRAGEYTLFDSIIGYNDEFNLGEKFGTLGVNVSYMYEYVRRYKNEPIGDTQYVCVELTLGGHFLEPSLYLERDIMADEGTYANLSIGHTIDICEGLTLCPSIGQGIGNSLRTKGYFSDDIEGFNHSGLMDSSIRFDLEYSLSENITLGAYVIYYDYLFDANMRQAARAHNSSWGSGENHSWNFVGGLSVKASF